MLSDRKLLSPEFQLLNDATAALVPNYFWQGLTKGFHQPRKTDGGSALECDLKNLVRTTDKALMKKLGLLLTGSMLDKDAESRILKLAHAASTERIEQIRVALFATLISPSAAIQR